MDNFVAINFILYAIGFVLFLFSQKIHFSAYPFRPVE